MPAPQCSRSTMTAPETPASRVPIVGECHSDVPSAGVTLLALPGAQATLVLISARHSNVDDHADSNVDPVDTAIPAWLDAQATADTLLSTHQAAMQQLLTPGKFRILYFS